MSRIKQRSTSSALRAVPRAESVAAARVPQIPRRSLAWIAVPTALATLGAGVFVNTVTPRYTGEAKVILESREAAFTRNIQDRAEPAAPIDEQAVASQAQVMMSRDLAREAIRQLKLVGNPEFDASAEEIGPVQRAMMLLGIGQNPLDRPAEDRVLDAFLDHLTVHPSGKSRIVAVEFQSADPALAAEAANTVAQLYISSLETDKVDTARSVSTWLGGNIASLRRRVAEAEGKVEAYRAKYGLVGASGVAGRPLTAQQLNELSSQLIQARVARADIAGRVTAIKELMKDGRAFDIADVANNEVIRRTIENRIAVRAQLALESRTLLPGHPRIKELKAQLEDLDSQIKISAERAVRTLENDAKIADARVASLQAAVDGQQDVVVKGNANEIELRALEREAKAQREQLDSSLSRYREASARDGEGAIPADARIVSRAAAPTIPSFPQKLPIIGFATLAAFLLSLGAVIGRALFDRRSKRSEAVAASDATERNPLMSRIDDSFVLPEAMSVDRWSRAASAFRMMPASAACETVDDREAAFDFDPLLARLSIRPIMPGAPVGRTVVLLEAASALPGQLPAALASAFARSGSVVTVDLNGTATVQDEPGLTDVVSGEADFVDAIRAGGPAGTHHVAAGQTDTEILFEEPRALAVVLEAMAEAYGWVICRIRDTSDAADLLALVAPVADSVVIASDADPSDEMLCDLYTIATEAGAGQVLIAQDRPALPARRDDESFRMLRLAA